MATGRDVRRSDTKRGDSCRPLSTDRPSSRRAELLSRSGCPAERLPARQPVIISPPETGQVMT